MWTQVQPDSVDVAAAVEAILTDGDDEALNSMSTFIALLRQRTRTGRSDADLRALITKKAAMRSLVIPMDHRE